MADDAGLVVGQWGADVGIGTGAGAASALHSQSEGLGPRGGDGGGGGGGGGSWGVSVREIGDVLAVAAVGDNETALPDT